MTKPEGITGAGPGGSADIAAQRPTSGRRAWAGPIYGLGIWLGFELVIAPAWGSSTQRSFV